MTAAVHDRAAPKRAPKIAWTRLPGQSFAGQVRGLLRAAGGGVSGGVVGGLSGCRRSPRPFPRTVFPREGGDPS